MKRKINDLLIILIIGLTCCWANASNNIYQGRVPIQDQTMARAFKQALKQVLIKVSGNPQVATVPSIQQQLNHPKQLVTSYQIIEHHKDDGQRYLQVEFAQSSINRLLGDNGQTLWIGQRPDIIACIAVKIGDDMYEEFRDNDYLNQKINQAAVRRGLTLVSPMTQFESSSMLKASDIWQLNMTALERARRSMAVDHSLPLLVGALTKQDNGQWRALWVLKDQGDTFQWHYEQQKLPIIVQNTFNRILSHLADHYSVLDSNHLRKEVTVNVNGVRAMKDLNRVSHSMKQMGLVSKVNVTQLRQHQAVLTVKIAGPVKQFMSRINQNEHVKSGHWHADADKIELEWER